MTTQLETQKKKKKIWNSDGQLLHGSMLFILHRA
jgi:hypothetical protein